MIRTYKFILSPTKSQRTKLNKSLGKYCEIYNILLETKIREYKENGKSLSCIDLGNLLPKMKEDDKMISELTNAKALQNVAVRIDLAFQAFFRRLKKGETPGFPRFKSKQRYNSFTFPQSSPRPRKGILKISKIGSVKIKLHKDFPQDKIKTLTISRDSIGNFFACFSCETEAKPLPATALSVGIDFGCKDIMTLSDNTKIENPKFHKQDLKELKKASSKYSTNKTKKTKQKLLHIHNRITNRRNNFCHQLSRQLINKYQILCIEDLDIQNMVEDSNKHALNRTIFDSSWYKLKQMISYKAEEAGRTIIYVPARNTTKECSSCGTLVPKTLSERTHNCPNCKLSMDRDLNAALNILRRGLSSLGGNPLKAIPAYAGTE